MKVRLIDAHRPFASLETHDPEPFVMRTRPAHLVLLACVLATPAARAGIFVCNTATGAEVTTDHASTDCLTYGGKELNPDGSVRRLILTPSQQNAAEADALQQRAAQAREQRAQREQRALLTRYPDRVSLEKAEATDLRTPLGLISGAQKRLAALAAERTSLDREAQFYPDHHYPVDLRSRFESNALLTRQEQDVIAQQRKEAARVRAEYADLLRRMQRLWARSATPVAP